MNREDALRSYHRLRIDRARVSRYLAEIRKGSMELRTLVAENHLRSDAIALKAAKYLLIELAEGMANTLQHILAKDMGVPVSGDIDTIAKAHQAAIVDADLFGRLKPFFDFRNSLVHRYWTTDDERLIGNIENGTGDFDRFIEAVESYLAQDLEKE